MKCPKCGGTGGVFLSVRMNGWAKVIMQWNGEIWSTNLDDLGWRYPRTGICGDCGKRVPSPAKALREQGKE